MTQKVAQALELRITGLSFSAIAKQCGYNSEQAAYMAVSAALRRTVQAPADEVRKLETVRMDALLTGIWTAAMQPASPEDQAFCETLTALLEGIRPTSAVQAAHLDALRAWVPLLVARIQAQHLDALDRVLKIMARRAALLGLDAPAKVAPTTPDGTQSYEGFAAQGVTDELVVGVAALLAQYGQLGNPQAGNGAGVAAEPLYSPATDA